MVIMMNDIKDLLLQIKNERDMCGMYLTAHPSDLRKEDINDVIKNRYKSGEDYIELLSVKQALNKNKDFKSYVDVYGTVENKYNGVTKTNKSYLRFDLFSDNNLITVFFWEPSKYSHYPQNVKDADKIINKSIVYGDIAILRGKIRFPKEDSKKYSDRTSPYIFNAETALDILE